MWSLMNRARSAGGFSQAFGSNTSRKVPKALGLGLDAKGLVGFQRAVVEIDVVVERDGIKAQVRAERPLVRSALDLAALDVVDRGRAERLRRLLSIASAAAGQPDVGRVVGPDGRRDVAVVEQAFLDRQHLVGTGAHQHDVDQPLGDDLAHQLAILGQRAEVGLVGVMLGALARRGQPERHVGVLGVGQDKVAARWVGNDPGKLLVQRFLHAVLVAVIVVIWGHTTQTIYYNDIFGRQNPLSPVYPSEGAANRVGARSQGMHVGRVSGLVGKCVANRGFAESNDFVWRKALLCHPERSEGSRNSEILRCAQNDRCRRPFPQRRMRKTRLRHAQHPTSQNPSQVLPCRLTESRGVDSCNRPPPAPLWAFAVSASHNSERRRRPTA